MSLKCNLSVRSDFSIGESSMTVGTVVDAAKTHGYEAIALVDTMTISSMVGFANKAKKAGIKPIVGCTIRVYDDPTYRKPAKTSGEKVKANPFYNLKVYVHDDLGMRSLLKLLSKGNSEEYFYYHARVGLDDVQTILENVSVTTGDMFGLFHHAGAEGIVRCLQASFGRDKVFVELVPIHTPLFDTLNGRALACARALKAPLIAGLPVFYAEKEGADALDVLRAISTNTQTSSPWLPIPFTRNHNFNAVGDMVKSINAMGKRLGVADCPKLIRECYASMGSIVESCVYEFKKLDPCLPKMAEDEFATLVSEVKNGWNVRFAAAVLGHKPTEEEMAVYRARLAYELSVLKKMGFSGYFLLVQDIVRWAKGNGIIVGPGRGSVGGSLVAYLVGITDVDPIRFGLLFERFINPSRIDLPDADLDFMSSRRHEIIEYIIAKYGQEYVAGVSNYSTLGPASALRDVARLCGLHPLEYACSKQVEKEHGVSLTLSESADKVPDIGRYKAEHPVQWDHSIRLEGVMRGLGQHAAGIVVANEPLINRAVVETRSGGSVVNWDKTTVEDWGLIKMDILGLSTLDVLKQAADFIRERHGRRIDYLRLPLNEPDVMRAFGKGETVGIFQFESSGMRRILRDLAKGGELTFEDITATTALYRPGPIDAGLVDQFVAVKQGIKAPMYEHEAMRVALTETHGVLTYQEQIMRVCQDLAGFSLVDADHVRKAMGKKDREKMAEWRVKFVEGAKAGFIEVELEDGTKKKVQRNRKFPCVDGVDRTVEEAIRDAVEVASLT